MFAFEKRWLTRILEAFAPPGSKGLSPDENAVDYVHSYTRMVSSATLKARIGMRAAIWIVAICPMLIWGRFRLAPNLPMSERTHLLRALLSHSSFLLRELTLLMKLGASMAIFATPGMRAKSGYDPVRKAVVDGREVEREDEVEDSGERPRISLPMAKDEVA